MVPGPELIPPKKKPRRKWLRRLAYVFGFVILLVCVGIALLQTDWAKNRVKEYVEQLAGASFHDGRLSIGELKGNLLFAASATDVRLFSGDSLVLAVDSVDAGYDLLSFLSDNIRLTTVDVRRPLLMARQDADSTWDLVRLFESEAPADAEEPPPGVRIDDLTVRNGRILARFHTANGDSVVAAPQVDVQAGDLYFSGERFGVTMDMLRATVTAPVAPDPVRLVASGEVTDERFVCALCTLESPRSSVSAQGHLSYDSESLYGSMLVQIDSLTLGDVAFAMPSVNPQEVIRGSASVSGSRDTLSANLDVTSLSGSYAKLDALIVRSTPARFRINGMIEGLDPATFLRDVDLAGAINADVNIDLLGSDLASVTGPVELRIFDSVLNDVDLHDGYLHGRVDSGRAELEARFFLPGADIQAKGSVTPFADTVSYDFSGTFQGTRLSSLYEALESVENAEARFSIAGRGIRLADATAAGTLHLSRLDGPSFSLREGTIRAETENGQISLDGSLALRNLGDGSPAGGLTFTLVATEIEDGWQIDVEDAAADGVSPGAVSADAATGSISGRGSGTATWKSGGIEQAQGVVTLSGFLDRILFTDLAGEIGFEDGAGSYSLSGVSNIGEADIRGRITSQDAGFGVTAAGQIRDANLDTLSTSRLATDLNGLVNATAQFGKSGLQSLRAEMRLDASRVNNQRIESALISTHLSDSLLSFEFDVDLPNGSIAGEGTMRPFSEAPVVDLETGSFAHINVGAWLDSEVLTSDLSGAINGRVYGSNVEASIEIDPSRLNLSRISRGHAELTSSDSTFVVTTELVTSEGNARGAISGQFGSDTTYQGLVAFRDLDFAALVGRDSLETSINAGCSFFGKGLSFPRLELSSLCTGRNSRVGGARIDTLRFEAALDAEALSLTSFAMSSNVGEFSGSGSIPTHERDVRSSRTIDFNFDIADLNPAAALVGAQKLSGDGTVVVSLGGSVESPSLNVDADLEYLEFDQYRVSSITGFLTVPDDPNGNILAAVDIGYSVLNDVPIQRTTIEVEKAGNSILMTSDFRIDMRRRGSLSARYEIREGDDLVVVDAVNLNLDTERWALSEPAEFEIGERWSVQTFLLFSSDQQIALDGYLDPDGEQNLIVTLEQIRLGAFSDLVGYPGLDGVGEGYVVLGGPHDDLELQSSINVRSVQTYGRDVGNFRLESDYRGERMQIDARLFHTAGDTLTVHGFVPLRLSMSGLESLRGDEQIGLEVQADSLPMAWIRPFLDQSLVDRFDGFLVSNVQIGGTWGEPALSGSGRLLNGRIRLPQFKLDMRPVDGEFRLDGDRLIIERAVAKSKTGTIDLAGSVGFRSLDDPTFDVDATFKEFRSINTETYQITATGSGRLTGSLIRPEFKGKVSVDDSEIFMTEELMADEVDPVQLTERDLRILERRFGYRAAASDTTAWDFYEALNLDLDASIGQNVWVRSYLNPKMDVEFKGDLSVTKLPQQDEIVTGTIQVNSSRSRVIIFGRRFDITQGEIQFNNDIDEALVDLNARYSVPSHFGGNEVQINLAITGSVGDMRMSLSSDPPMDTGEMVSYLTTGRPPGEGSVGGTQAAELAVNSLGGLVEGFANQELGLDVVEIQASPMRGTYLTVGKYLSPRVYASFTQPIITNDNYGVGDATHQTEVAIEYELVSWLLAKVKPSRNQVAVNLIWEFAF